MDPALDRLIFPAVLCMFQDFAAGFYGGAGLFLCAFGLDFAARALAGAFERRRNKAKPARSLFNPFA